MTRAPIAKKYQIWRKERTTRREYWYSQDLYTLAQARRECERLNKIWPYCKHTPAKVKK